MVADNELFDIRFTTATFTVNSYDTRLQHIASLQRLIIPFDRFEAPIPAMNERGFGRDSFKLTAVQSPPLMRISCINRRIGISSETDAAIFRALKFVTSSRLRFWLEAATGAMLHQPNEPLATRPSPLNAVLRTQRVVEACFRGDRQDFGSGHLR